jgi:DNA-directed RNA polymerase alpha subunit
MTDYKERAIKIVSARLDGRTYADIGSQHGICGARVSQIITKAIRRSKKGYMSPAEYQCNRIANRQAELKAGRKSRAKYATTALMEDFALSVRSSNVCMDNGFKFLSQVIAASDAELMRLPNCGRKSLNELRMVEKNFIAGVYM